MTEKKFIITESQINEILYFLKNKSLLSIKNLLKQLPLYSDTEKISERNKEVKSNE